MKIVPIGTGLTVELPEAYDVVEEPDGAIAAFPSGDETVTLRFNHLTFNPREPVENAALLYVRESARQSQRRTFKFYGEKGVTEHDEAADEEGEKLLIKYWEVALDMRLVIISATILDEQKDQPNVVEVLNAVPAMIESLKYTVPGVVPPAAQP
jgi:hypothetical protein